MARSRSTANSGWPVRLTYLGNPATKKNSRQIRRFKRRGEPKMVIAPSAAYEALLELAAPQIRQQWKWPPLYREKLHVTAWFYCGYNQKPDLSGLIESCGDILQACGVIANDYWIASWDGSRRLRDLERPRTEVIINKFDADEDVLQRLLL